MIISLHAYNQDDSHNIKPFSYLETFSINDEITIHYDKSSATLINWQRKDLPEENPLYTNGFGADDILVLDLKLDKASDISYYLVFSYGPSADPSFIFYEQKTNIAIKTFHGLDIYIPGNNVVYIAGHTNNYFNERKKFTFKNNTFTEVEQPYYYVGLKTKTLNPVNLYADKALNHKIAHLPANYSIEVLVADTKGKSGNLYLIKTSFGLVGWAKIKTEQNYGSDIEGIFYSGD